MDWALTGRRYLRYADDIVCGVSGPETIPVRAKLLKLGLESREEPVSEGKVGLHLGLQLKTHGGRVRSYVPYGRLLNRWKAKNHIWSFCE